MIAEILSVGTELLMGQTANTDAQYLSQKLPEMGVYVYRHTVVGDNPARLRDTVHEALARCDVLITTGGLGPTQDDLTKQTVAEALGLPLQRDAAVVAQLRAYFAHTGREMAPNNLQQADFPVGSTVLENAMGTAPGCAIEHEGKVIIILPGPPRELHWVYEHAVVPYLQHFTGTRLYSRFLRFQGIGESDLEYRIRDIIANQSNPTIAPYVSGGEITLRLTAAGEEQQAMRLLDDLQQQVLVYLQPYFFTDTYASLAETAVREMAARGLTLALAESCTGGLISNRLVEIDGASQMLLAGFVTYSNQSKTAVLGVTEDTLAQYGAVSEQTARAMALGAKKAAGADYALATTGIAGPGGGSAEKPVGTVYIALATPAGEVIVRRHQFQRDRNTVRNRAATTALGMLVRHLLDGE